jgi:hypothetical protein
MKGGVDLGAVEAVRITLEAAAFEREFGSIAQRNRPSGRPDPNLGPRDVRLRQSVVRQRDELVADGAAGVK